MVYIYYMVSKQNATLSRRIDDYVILNKYTIIESKRETYFKSNKMYRVELTIDAQNVDPCVFFKDLFERIDDIDITPVDIHVYRYEYLDECERNPDAVFACLNIKKTGDGLKPLKKSYLKIRSCKIGKKHCF